MGQCCTDEAGRGPVLGPMVYGCAYCPLTMKHALTERYIPPSAMAALRRCPVFCLQVLLLMATRQKCLQPRPSMQHAGDRTNANCRSFADSKTLNEEKRDSLFQEIAEDTALGTAVDVLDACILSAQMLARCSLSVSTCLYTSTHCLRFKHFASLMWLEGM